MTSQPLVSAVINNYNYGRFLRDAIDSALNQTYRNIEVIVVDDGSTDDSQAIIMSYGSRVVPILKGNGGQASAMNAGFAVCKGEIVCLLDSDDVWLPRKVEGVVEAAVKEPESVLIYHRYQTVSEDCRPCSMILPEGLFRGSVSKRAARSGGWWECPPTSALCFSRRILETIGPIPEVEFGICADGYLMYLVPLLGPVVGLKDCLALYRLHGSNNFSAATRAKDLRDREHSKHEAERLSRLLDSVNHRLIELKSREKLNLDDHVSYQVYRYRASLPGHLRRDQLAWRTLTLAGDPVLLRRIKASVKILVNG